MRCLFLPAVLFAIGCSEAQKETSRESDPQLNYLQAAEEVKAEEKRLEESQAELAELNRLIDQYNSVRIATAGSAGDAEEEKQSESEKKIADALARGHKKIAEQEKRVAEARARRDALSSR